MPEEQLTMDRAHERMIEINAVLRFVLRNWPWLPEPLQILEVVSADLANAITPSGYWRMMAEADGVKVPGNETNNPNETCKGEQ